MATSSEERIVLAHGGGGELGIALLRDHVLPRLGNEVLNPLHDAAVFSSWTGRVAMTSDSFVVQPLSFPGGDIGRLAVCGTVNDLAVMGARPRGLSLAMVLEEGLALSELDTILDSIATASREAGVPIVTGDTKVVERGRGDGMTLTTAGVGELDAGLDLRPDRARAGDVVLVTGGLAEHGLAVMSAREDLHFETALRSDVAPLNGLAQAILASKGDVKFMRDPTRGGLAGVLCDLVEASGLTVELSEDAIPMTATVRHTAELLGLDPLTVANEGKIVIVVSERDAPAVLAACHAQPLGRKAAMVARLVEAKPPLVELITRLGGRRIVQRPYGEDLPRIC